jgi:hypothetical protein
MFKLLRRRRAAPRQYPSFTSPPGSGLQVCSRCHASFVHPVDWCEADDEHWWMLLRCGECAAEREVTIGDDVAKRYGEDLDAAQHEIDRLVQRLDGERMAAQTRIFVEALERDLIGADDFVVRRTGHRFSSP